MKIFYQEQENECGICVIGMLVNELHDISLNRSDLILKANLTNSGMSIAALENLASEYGIELESYECNYQEFLELDNSQYYVVLVRRIGGFHYVIVKLQNTKIKIYDSSKGKYYLSIKEFEKEFSNLIFTVKSKELKIELNKNKKISLFQVIDLSTFLVLVFSQIIAIGFGLAVSQLFKVIINDVIAIETTVNLFGIIIPFTVMKLMEILSKSLITWIQTKKFKLIYKKWWNIILNLLIYQDFKFFTLSPFGTVFELDHHLSNVINFYLSQTINLFSAVIMIITTTAILSSIGSIFILISVAQFFIEIIFALINFFFQKNKIPKIMAYSEIHNKFLNELQSSLKNENNFNHFQLISQNINNNIYQTALLNQNNFSTLSIMDNANQIIKYIFLVLILAIGASVIIENQNVKLADIMYAITIQMLFLSYCDNLINFALSTSPFINSFKKINGFLNTQNQENNQDLYPLEIEKITFEKINFFDGKKIIFNNWNGELKNLTMIVGPNASGKSTLLKLLTTKMELNSGEIKINDVNIEKISKKWLIENVVYLDGLKKNIDSIVLSKILGNTKNFENKKEVIELFNTFNIFSTSPNKYSSGQQQVIKLSFLLNCENKIILLDECLSAIDEKIKQQVFEVLVKNLAKQNFVIFAEHDKELKTYANSIVEILHHEI